MAQVRPKNFVLRVFKIANPYITESTSGILRLLGRTLTSGSLASQRKMQLNPDEPDNDLLASYSWGPSNSYLFGMMMRIMPADNGGIIEDTTLQRNQVTMDMLTAGSPGHSQYKHHFYFAINNEYLVTNLSSNQTIENFQIYINWLLRDIREELLFNFSEMTKVPEGLEISAIKDIQILGSGSGVSSVMGNETFTRTFKNLVSSALEILLGNDTEKLNAIRQNELVEARLQIKFRSKPKDMSREQYTNAMSALATNITNDNSVVVHTKDGAKYTGADVKVRKKISVPCVAPNRIVEESMKQEMEVFLREIRNEGNI